LRLLSKVRTAQGSLLLGPVPHDPERSAQFCRQALDLLDHPALTGQDTRSEKAYALLTLGTAHRWSGEHPEAKQRLEQSLALYTSLGDRCGAASASRLLADTVAALGDHETYIRLHRQALALAEGAGDRVTMTGSLNQLRGEALRQGQHERAEQYGHEAVTTMEELGRHVQLWWALDGLGHVLVRRGRYAQARERFAQSQALTEDLGGLDGVAWTGIQLGHVEMHLGRYDRAREEGERALALCREQHILPHLGQHALLLLGSVALAEGAYAHAEALLAESIAVFRQDRGPPGLEQALAVQALSALKLGQTDMAWQRLREVVLDAGLHDFEEGLYVPRLTAALACVLLLAERGDDERASQVYALASHDPHVAHSRWFADVCEGKIAAAAPQLRGHGFARARTTIDAYGQAGDLVAVLEDVLAESGNSSAIKHSP
jgi:tetratricopeptide (TPR) repeat protein